MLALRFLCFAHLSTRQIVTFGLPLPKFLLSLRITAGTEELISTGVYQIIFNATHTPLQLWVRNLKFIVTSCLLTENRCSDDFDDYHGLHVHETTHCPNNPDSYRSRTHGTVADLPFPVIDGELRDFSPSATSSTPSSAFDPR